MNKEINIAFSILLSLGIVVLCCFCYFFGEIKGITEGYEKACNSYTRTEYKIIKGEQK